LPVGGSARRDGRSSIATKKAFTDELLTAIDQMATQLAPDDPRSAQRRR
jgi:hypothetical protein